MLVALLFEASSLVPVAMMVAIALMLIVTIRQITGTSKRDRGEPRDRDSAAYISSSSDPRAVGKVTPVPDASAEDDDSAPIDMSRGEPSIFTDEEKAEGPPTTPVAIKSFNFRTFDADTGPPDPDCFYDELLTELYDANTGRVWLTSYFVATPNGLARFMRDQKWSAMFGNNHLIVARYDRTAVVDAILRQMNDAWEVSSQDTGQDNTGDWRG